LILILAGALSVVGSLFYHHWLDPQHLIDPNRLHWLTCTFLLSGIILFVVGRLVVDYQNIQSRQLQIDPGTWIFLGIYKWQIVLLIFSICLSGIAWIAAGDGPIMRLPWLAIVAWLAGIFLVMLGGWKQNEKAPRLNLKLLLPIFLLGGIAFLIRGIDTTHIPHVLSGDEASSGLAAVEFITGRVNNIFTLGWSSFPSLFYAIQSFPIRILGQTIPALRLLSAFGGGLTVCAVFLVAREMFGDLVGLAAGIYLAAFHFHVNFSRIGMNNIWDGFWFVVTLGLFWKGWQSERRAFFLWAGLSLGLSQYFYMSARILPVVVWIWFFLVCLFDRTRFNRLRVDFLLGNLVAIVVFIPLGIFFIIHSANFIAPIERVSIFGDWMVRTVNITGMPPWKIVLEQLRLGVFGFTYVNIRYWYNPGVPLLRPVSATLFILGLILLMRKPKDSRSLLLGLWLLVFIFLVSFSESTPASQRLVGVSGAVAIIIGYGAMETLSVLGQLSPRLAKAFIYLGLCLIVITGLDDLRFYFLEYEPSSDFGGDHTLIAQNLADLLKGRSSEWEVLFFGAPQMGYRSIMSLSYLVPQIRGVDMPGSWGALNNPTPTSDHLVFVFLPDHAADLASVQLDYPDGKLREIQRRYPNYGVLYWTYEVSSETSQ